jgi:DNA-binding NarL/FixJ family response regulator
MSLAVDRAVSRKRSSLSGSSRRRELYIDQFTPEQTVTTAESLSPRRSRLEVFHIDDEIQQIEKFRRLLEHGDMNEKVSLSSYLSVEHFLYDVIMKKPDVVVLDYFCSICKHGGLTGEHLAKACKSLQPNMKIIMRSSLYGDETDVSEVKAYGADGFISKSQSTPIQLSQLLT